MLGRVGPTGGTYAAIVSNMYRPRCRGSSHTATVLGYSYNCQTAVCTDTCPNQLMKFCPCNGVMRRLASRFRTRKTCSKRHSLPPNKHGGFVATQCHVRCDVMPSSRISYLPAQLLLLNYRYLQLNCRYLQIGLFEDICKSIGDIYNSIGDIFK